MSISCEKMGDLLRALGQGDEARAFYRKSLEIRERLARDEPRRADFQTDLVASLVRATEIDPSSRTAHLGRALSILQALQRTGRLSPDKAGWVSIIERELEGRKSL